MTLIRRKQPGEAWETVIEETDAQRGVGMTFEWRFNSTTTEPPGNNQVRLNNATQTSATKIWTQALSENDIDTSLWMGLVQTGSLFIIQDRDDSSKYQVYQVTAPPTDDGDYFDTPVSHVTGGSDLVEQTVRLTIIFKLT